MRNDYKFLLAFEMGVCKEYVTESFFKMDNYILPIVLREEDLLKLAPKDSFLAVDNFTSVEALGKYLKRLDENDDEYARYFQWRNDKKIGYNGCYHDKGLCQLCDLLHKGNLGEMIVDDAETFWGFEDNECSLGYLNFLPLRG